MKHLHIFILVILISVSTSHAQNGKGHGGGMGPQYGKVINNDDQAHKMSNLRVFLSMSDEQLERMESAIRDIREMSPGEKEALREKLDAYNNLPQRQRESMTQAWGQLDQKIKDAWRKYVDSLDQDQLDKLRQQMDALSHSDRFEFRMNLLKEKGLIEKQ